MVIPQLSVFCMAQEFALTARKLDTCNILAISYDVTDNDLTLICCIVYDVNNRAICRLIATHYHLTSKVFPSLVSLGTSRGVMLQFLHSMFVITLSLLLFYVCYCFIFAIDVSLVISLCLLSLYDPTYLLFLLSTTDNGYV